MSYVTLASIDRVFHVSESWLQNYVNRKYESILRKVKISKKRKSEIQCDEM